MESGQETGRKERSTVSGKGLFSSGVKAERQLVGFDPGAGGAGEVGWPGDRHGMRAIPGRGPDVGTSNP